MEQKNKRISQNTVVELPKKPLNKALLWVLSLLIVSSISLLGGWWLGKGEGYQKGYENGVSDGEQKTLENLIKRATPPKESEFGKFESLETEGLVVVIGKVESINETSITVNFKLGTETYILNQTTKVFLSSTDANTQAPQEKVKGIEEIRAGDIIELTYKNQNGADLVEFILIYR